MKQCLAVSVMLLFISCTTAKLLDSWINPEIESYTPNKVLVIGMTPNNEARIIFEQNLKNELALRGINAFASSEIFSPSVRTEKMTEEELIELETKLTNDGFDTVLFSKIIGIEDKITYKDSFYDYEKTYRKFREDYFMFQDIYYNPEYYNEFKVYHAETSLYCICPAKSRELIWKGTIDIIDPKSIQETVYDYVNLVLFVLEDEQLINQKLLEEDIMESKPIMSL